MTPPLPPLASLIARLEAAAGADVQCPFDTPGFSMDPKEPCPVCGETGEIGPMWEVIVKDSPCVAGRALRAQEHPHD